MIIVYDPWQNAQQTQYSYLLSDSVSSSRMISPGESIIKVPVESVICLSTTHIGFIDYLGKTGTIVGVSGIDFVVNNQLRNRIDQNMLSDVGYDENISYELLLKLNPDIVFVYGVTAAVTKVINKLYELNIPVVVVAEYLEICGSVPNNHHQCRVCCRSFAGAGGVDKFAGKPWPLLRSS